MNFPALTEDELESVMDDVAQDALRMGIEREDIDPSWFGEETK